MHWAARYGLGVCCLLILACSSDGSKNTLSIKTGAESISNGCTFPLGADYAAYDPPVLSILSPEPGTVLEDADTVRVCGTVGFTDPMGSPREISSLTVNGRPASPDPLTGAFSVNVPITRDDAPFFPILVRAEHGSDPAIVRLERLVTMLREPATTPTAAILSGDMTFLRRLLVQLLSAFDGLNLADPAGGTIDLPECGTTLVPRALMLQGPALSSAPLEIRPADRDGDAIPDADCYDLVLGLTFERFILEYTLPGSGLAPGHNVCNIEMEDLGMEGLILHLEKNAQGRLSARLNFPPSFSFAGQPLLHLDLGIIEPFVQVMEFIRQVILRIGSISAGPFPPVLTRELLNLVLRPGDTFPSTTPTGTLDIPLSRLLLSAQGITLVGKGEQPAALPGLPPHCNSLLRAPPGDIQQTLDSFFPKEPVHQRFVLDTELTALIGKLELWNWITLLTPDHSYPELEVELFLRTPARLDLKSETPVLRIRDLRLSLRALTGDDTLTLWEISLDTDLLLHADGRTFSIAAPLTTHRPTTLINRIYPLLLPPEIVHLEDTLATALGDLLHTYKLLGLDLVSMTAAEGALDLGLQYAGRPDLPGMERLTLGGLDETWERIRLPLSATPGGALQTPPNTAELNMDGIRFAVGGDDASWDDSLAFHLCAPPDVLVAGVALVPEISWFYRWGMEILDPLFPTAFAALSLTLPGPDTDSPAGICPRRDLLIPRQLDATGAGRLWCPPPVQEFGVGFRLKRARPINPAINVDMCIPPENLILYTVPLRGFSWDDTAGD